MHAILYKRRSIIKTKIMKYILALTFCCFFSLLNYGQGILIEGKVVDDDEKVALPGAHINLYASGKRVKSNISGFDGNFKLRNIEDGTYELKISFLGFETFQQTLNITGAPIQLGSIALKTGSNELSEVEVVEKTPAAIQLGDTTQFNSNAYKTNPDATAEDLIKKMPGIEVENGQVKAEGENVQQVLVDGKEFFGTDPNAALKNLPAEVIQSIQVFDQKSDQSQFTGVDDGETTKTINIVTRTDRRVGQFGNVYAGYGTDERYRAGGTINFFNKAQRISIIGQANNINQQNFSTDDILGVVGSGGGRRRGGGGRGPGGRGGSSVNNFLVNQSGGISETQAFGINYNDEWGKKTEANLSYFINRSENVSSEIIDRQFYEVLDNQVYNESNLSNSTNINHRLSGKFDIKLNDRNSLMIRPNLRVQLNDGTELTNAQTNTTARLLNSTNNDYRSDLTAINFSNSLMWRHKMKKARRSISLSFRTNYSGNEGESLLNSFNLFNNRGTTTLDTLNQFADLNVDGWTYRGSVSYTEPLGKGALSMGISSSYQIDDSDREVLDFAESTQDYTLFNTTLSNIFSNKYYTQEANAGYNIRMGKTGFFMVRGIFQWAQLDSQEEFPQMIDQKRNFYNFLPMAMYRYRVSRAKSFRAFYRSRTNLPTIQQLQNVVDNSNPLQLSTGNPGLGQSNIHGIYLRYNQTNTEKASVFYVRFNAEYGFNYIANATFLANSDHPIFNDPAIQPGAQITQPVNIDGYYNLRTFVTYGFPIKTLKSNLNTTVSLSRSRTPGQINDQENFANNTNTSLGLTLSSNISKRVDFTLSSKSSFNFLTYSLQDELDNNFLNQTSSASLTWYILEDFVFRSSLVNQFYGGLSDDVDDNYFLWNMEIGKKLFKNKRGEIKLAVFDLLGQNTSIQRTVTDTYFEDTQTQVLQQYFMLSFVYQLRHFGKAPEKKKEPKPWERGPRGGF